MPTWAWLLLLFAVVLVMIAADYFQRAQAKQVREVAVQHALLMQKRDLYDRVRVNGIRYQISIVERPLGGWRWSIWDADGALRPLGSPDAGLVLPYGAGNATTKADAEAQALAEVEGLRLQERIDEVLVV